MGDAGGMNTLRRPFTALALGLIASIGLSGCVFAAGSQNPTSPEDGIIEIGADELESNPVTSVEFSLNKPVQGYDDSTYIVQDTAAISQFEAALLDHSEHGEPFEDADMTGGTTADVKFTQADGATGDLKVRNYEGDTQKAIVELLEGWHQQLPELYVEDEIVEAIVTSSVDPAEIRVSDAAQLDELASAMRDHGIFSDYSSPLPETMPTLGTAVYDVTVTLAGGDEITLHLDPAALETASFSAVARGIVADWS